MEVSRYLPCDDPFVTVVGDCPIPPNPPTCDKIKAIQILTRAMDSARNTLMGDLPRLGLAQRKWMVEREFFPYTGRNNEPPIPVVEEWAAGCAATAILMQIKKRHEEQFGKLF